MKSEKQDSPERTELCRLIQHMTVAMMTTANADGGLTSRPMAPLLTLAAASMKAAMET